MADLGAQLRHVVAVALLAEFAEAAEILTDLGGRDVHLRAQRIGGDADDALVVEVIQIAVVAGEPVDHGVGDLLLFHIKTFFWDEMRCVAPETMVLFYRMTGELSTFLTIFQQKSF